MPKLREILSVEYRKWRLVYDQPPVKTIGDQTYQISAFTLKDDGTIESLNLRHTETARLLIVNGENAFTFTPNIIGIANYSTIILWTDQWNSSNYQRTNLNPSDGQNSGLDVFRETSGHLRNQSEECLSDKGLNALSPSQLTPKKTRSARKSNL